MKYEKNQYYDIEKEKINEPTMKDFTGLYCDIHGTIYRFKSGLLHSENDKPAIESVNGDKHWYKHGVQHREDYPAIVYADDNTEDEFYFNGMKINLKDFVDILKQKE